MAQFDEPDSFYGRTSPLRDVGGQLRFDLNSHYSLPTRIQLDLAHGLDEMAERSPWKFLYDRAVRILISSAARSPFVGETIDDYTNDSTARIESADCEHGAGCRTCAEHAQ